MADLTISIATIENAVKGLGKLDLNAAWNMLRSGDIQQELIVGEEAADVISAFWPEAQYAEDALKLLGFVIALKQAGVWSSGEPTDPAMVHAEGRQTGTPNMHQTPVIAPGGTAEDPYAWGTGTNS